MKKKESLADKVEALIPVRTNGSEGLSNKEVALMLNKSPAHTSQILLKLCIQGKIARAKERKGTARSKTYYFKRSSPSTAKAVEDSCSNLFTELEKEFVVKGKEKKPKCGNCQKFSGIGRCILLDLASERAPWALRGEFKERFDLEELAPNTPACEYYDPRVDGHCFSKTMNVFIGRNITKDLWTFHCPIERCRKPIEELSYPLRIFRIGSSTFYCPHCGSPMIFGYNKALDRYEVKYWDSHFDILQRDFKKLTNSSLHRRKSAKNFGISIGKAGSFQLD